MLILFFFRIGFKNKEEFLCSFVPCNIRWLGQQWRSRVTSLCALKWFFCVRQCLFNNRCYVRIHFKLQRLTNPKHLISRKIAFAHQNTRRDRLLCRSVQSRPCKTLESIENCVFADRKFHGWLINLRLIRDNARNFLTDIKTTSRENFLWSSFELLARTHTIPVLWKARKCAIVTLSSHRWIDFCNVTKQSSNSHADIKVLRLSW